MTPAGQLDGDYLMEKRKDSQATLAFCPTLADMAATGQTVGRSGARIPAPGLSSVNSLLILRNLQLAQQSAKTLEIGFGFGASSLVFTQTHKDLGSPPKKQHLSIDPFARDWDDAGNVAVERAGPAGWLDFRPEFSCLELPRLLAAGEQFDLAFIDGSHHFEDVFVRVSTARAGHSTGKACPKRWATYVKSLKRALRRQTPEVGAVCGKSARTRKTAKYIIARQLGRAQLTAFKKVSDVGRPPQSILRSFWIAVGTSITGRPPHRSALRKIFVAASPAQIIAFLGQLLSPKLPVKPLLALAFQRWAYHHLSNSLHMIVSSLLLLSYVSAAHEPQQFDNHVRRQRAVEPDKLKEPVKPPPHRIGLRDACHIRRQPPQADCSMLHDQQRQPRQRLASCDRQVDVFCYRPG
jgi:Methyltransferase domain